MSSRPCQPPGEEAHRSKAGLQDPSDLTLIERVLSGDARAFETLVRRHERRVYRTVLAITGNVEDAEEALQDTFLKTYQHLHEFQQAALFTTWLTRIAVNEGLQRLRRRRDVVSLDDPDHAPPEVTLKPQRTEEWPSDPEKRYAALEVKQMVEAAIRELPPPYRVVFMLRDVEGLSTQETAETLELSIPGVKSRLLRARLMMREQLAAYFQQPATLQSRIRRAGMMVRHALEMGFERVARAGKE